MHIFSSPPDNESNLHQIATSCPNSVEILPSSSSIDQMNNEEQQEYDKSIALPIDGYAMATNEESLSSDGGDFHLSQVEEEISVPQQEKMEVQEVPSTIEPDGANFASPLNESMLFLRPKASANTKTKLNLIDKRPIQPNPVNNKLPFDSSKIFYRKQPDGEKIQRKWLSYSCDTNRIYCALCLCYDKFNSNSPFASSGYRVNVKYVYEKVAKHKESQSHVNSVKAYIAAFSEKDVGSLIEKEGMSRQQEEVQQNRMVIHRIINIILLLAKQNMAFRGHHNEGAASLEDPNKNHGNFLEIFSCSASMTKF